jgi:glycosyl hydrolase family 115 (putative glucuronidase)/glycosyl hydrolase family 115
MTSGSYVTFEEVSGGVCLAQRGRALPVVVDGADHAGVRRAVADFVLDLERVSGVRPPVLMAAPEAGAQLLIIGTLGQSPLIDSVVAHARLDLETLPGSWERWLRVTVDAPLPGVERALLIIGSDRRGTMYGVYDLCEQIGVSPWYWWADVPVARRSSLFVSPERQLSRSPEVKYRGIFLNDEAPALSAWARDTFGGFNRRFYSRVFELLLRLKANTLWPAMWGNAFNEDDPDNPKLADEYGIVMGTSHHEPMLRAQREWHTHGQGPWDYAKNGEVLRKFWAEGIERNKDYESIITLGMRGDGDMPMSEQDDIALLERIVQDQRGILADHFGGQPERVPQVWALYKEVQAYYDKGMRVPDDVTLLYCDDNWGNLRRLPSPDERKRPGGAGIYYHFDYVGGPRSYKWLNTTPIGKIWEQMRLAAEYGATQLWIVNVGDLKPMEFAIDFFLRFAWAPSELTFERLEGFASDWARREFGPEHATEIGELVLGYTRINGRRKPELLEPSTYSLVNYREAERAVAEYHALEARAVRLHQALPVAAKSAFYQLVLHPITACATLYDLLVSVGKNRLYAVQGRASTNWLFERARALFRADAELTRVYNDELSGGKWRHLMDQTHIGYTYWQQPVHDALPAVSELLVPARAQPALAIEGSERAWPSDDPNQGPPVLPPLDVFARGSRYVDVFNRGTMPFSFRATPREDWLIVSPREGQVELETRVEVSVDWSRAPHGSERAELTLEWPGGGRLVVALPVFNPSTPRPSEVQGFVECDGYVSIEAAHYSRAVGAEGIAWQQIPEHGREHSALTTVPVSAPPSELGADGARLEYALHLFSAGQRTLDLYVSPTLDCLPGRRLRCGVSFDDEAPQLVDVLADDSPAAWSRAVSDGVRQVSVSVELAPGAHVLKLWRVDPALVLQKLVLHGPGLRPSYLGPPESPRGPLAEPVAEPSAEQE